MPALTVTTTSSTSPAASVTLAGSRPVELSVTDRLGPSGDRPMTTAWVSDELLEKTVEVWSKAYGRPITTQDAMEILVNVKRFAELLIRVKEDNSQ